MPRSSLLRSTALVAAFLLATSGCSAARTALAGGSSPSPNRTRQVAEEGGPQSATGESEELDGGKPLDPLEYGNCTSADVRDYDEELTDGDEEDTRAQAEAQVTKVVPASDQVHVTADAVSSDGVVKVSAGAKNVTISATNLVVIIDGDIESLTVHGFNNTVWIDSARQVTFGSSDDDNLNHVFWHSTPPQSKVDPEGANVVGKDVHAPVIRSCSVFS